MFELSKLDQINGLCNQRFCQSQNYSDFCLFLYLYYHNSIFCKDHIRDAKSKFHFLSVGRISCFDTELVYAWIIYAMNMIVNGNIQALRSVSFLLGKATVRQACDLQVKFAFSHFVHCAV